MSVFNKENIEQLSLTCKNIESILAEHSDGALMAMQAWELGHSIKEFIANPIVVNSGLLPVSQGSSTELLDVANDVDTVGNCANCGVEFHIHKYPLINKHTSKFAEWTDVNGWTFNAADGKWRTKDGYTYQSGYDGRSTWNGVVVNNNPEFTKTTADLFTMYENTLTQ